jgi:hypothetical protein
MSWGWKIVLVYAVFVVMTLSMVVYFMGHKVDLVAEDYYKQEIEYQDQIDKIANTQALQTPIALEFSANRQTISLHFPSTQLQSDLVGRIQFYRPSDSSMDRMLDLAIDQEGKQLIGVEGFAGGLWRVKISWTVGGKAYYDEKVITL